MFCFLIKTDNPYDKGVVCSHLEGDCDHFSISKTLEKINSVLGLIFAIKTDVSSDHAPPGIIDVSVARTADCQWEHC